MMAVGAAAAHAEDTIKVGVLATLEGAFTVLGEDSVRGAELAFQEHNIDGGRQEARDRQGLIRRLAGQRGGRGAQARRAGRRRRS